MSVMSSTIGRRRDAGLALRVLGVVLAAGVLSGCYATKETVGVPNDYRKRHQIGLREGTRTVEIFIGQSRSSLNPTQRAEVLAFAQTWKNEATGGVIIDVPAGAPNQFAASQALREINSILTATGMPPQSIAVRPYQAVDPAQYPTVRLNYSRIMAEAGPCGLWPADLGPSFTAVYNENVPYWNLGCANQRNLAAMVANPTDLVQPRAETPAWTARRTTVLERYRAGQPSGTQFQNTQKGQLSDIGR